MKLYTKHPKIIGNYAEMSNMAAAIDTYDYEVFKQLRIAFDSRNTRIRRQAWLDSDVGRTFLKTPFLFKGNYK